ncbi:MAG: hypothetical protein H0T60_07640 [Acidobacteria bacterium]|nr:hypothetical protein [Acidobacteriota bacterium]
MKTKVGRNERLALPHSERAGEAVLGSGERATLYRALRELPCSRCAGVIRKGDLFTRESDRAGGLPLVRRCRTCVPLTASGELLDALLTAEEVGGTKPVGTTADVSEKIVSRLGPALAASRKRRGGPDSEG